MLEDPNIQDILRPKEKPRRFKNYPEILHRMRKTLLKTQTRIICKYIFSFKNTILINNI